jgi:hypothetical protein
VDTAPLAWSEVSTLEEQLAALLRVCTQEGRIARRGAVRAALKARDYSRAEELACRYATEDGAPDSLRAAFEEMFQQDARKLEERFPYATKRHAVNEVRDLARQIRDAGAFGLGV